VFLEKPERVDSIVRPVMSTPLAVNVPGEKPPDEMLNDYASDASIIDGKLLLSEVSYIIAVRQPGVLL
jgi:hypothetical protein